MTQADTAVAIDRLRDGVALFDAMNEQMTEARSKYLNGSFRGDDVRSLITAYESQAERLREVEGALERAASKLEYAAEIARVLERPNNRRTFTKAAKEARSALTQSPPATDSTDV